MITQVRAAHPTLVLNGIDYFNKLAPYFLNLSYTDNCDGEKADDLQLQLADRDKRFISDWMPDKGTFIDVSIVAERWFSPNATQLSLDCGRFWIDTIDFELPQHTVSIKASSIPTSAHIKASNETRGWENTSLQDIANQIAGENGMSVDWQADVNPRYKRVEQTEQSGLEFLMHRAKDAKLAIKVHRTQIVFFDEEKMEAAEPAFALVYGNAAPQSGMACYRMSGGTFTTRLTDTTKKARVKHNNPGTGKVTSEEFGAEDEDLEDDHVQDVNEDPGDDEPSTVATGGDELRTPREGEDELIGGWDEDSASSSGQRKAKSVVRDANKEKETSTIDLSLGNPLIAAGQTFTLSGVGKYDGKWFVVSAEHTLAPMYDTKLTVRRCLKGY